MNQLTHELFLLMLNLSQLRDPDRITQLFVDALNAMQDELELALFTDTLLFDNDVIPIRTTHNHFGWIKLHQRKPAESDFLPALIRNAIRMLAIVLENEKRARLLADTNRILEAQVVERTQRLQHSEERYRTLVENAPLAIIVCQAGQFRYLNPAAVRLYGATNAEQLLDQPVLPLIHAEDQALLVGILNHATTTHTPAMQEMRAVRLDGTPLRIEVTAIYVIYDQDESHLLICQDITLRKATELELARYRSHLEEVVDERTADLRHEMEERMQVTATLRQRTEELEALTAKLYELSRVKDEFITNISHELRTPVANLKLREHILSREPDRVDVHLPVLQRETDRLINIIENLLDLSSLDRGFTEAYPVPQNLNMVTEQYVMDRASLAAAKQITMDCASLPEHPPVVADKFLLDKAINIMLTNAVNYTPSGGHITVSVCTRALDGRHWVGVQIRDNGPGIPEDELPHIFERFFRGRIARETSTLGTGLGLAILTEIANLHHGDVEVASAGIPGEGSTFTLWLPCTTPHTPS